MLEQDEILFFDLSGLRETKAFREKARESLIRAALETRFPGEIFPEIDVSVNTTGVYKRKFSAAEMIWGTNGPVRGLPPYAEVRIVHRTGEHSEIITVGTPAARNGRFAGTAGGGTSTGGETYLTKPKNTQRGWTVPFAVMNGFTAATVWAGNSEGTKDYVVDAKTGAFSRELYENWRAGSTHRMTVIGKAVAEILHDRPVEYSYMHGGSGGGRQCLMEVQLYPFDYDGVWASCPAINWHKFLCAGLWPSVVMNEYRHFLPPGKNAFFLDHVHEKYGGKEAYYAMRSVPSFDAADCVGMKAPGGVVTAEDARVMNEIWAGPSRKNGERLWYACRPGVRNWLVGIPLGTYWYPLFARRVRPFILAPFHARWITGDPKETCADMKKEEFCALFDEGLRKFGDSLGDNPAIDAFAGHGGKLMIDHGTDDPLIPVDGTLDYAEKLLAHFGRNGLAEFFRLYVTPGDNHGNCWGNGPGITVGDGMRALTDWVEKGTAPDSIRKVRVDRKSGKLLAEGREDAWDRTR